MFAYDSESDRTNGWSWAAQAIRFIPSSLWQGDKMTIDWNNVRLTALTSAAG